MKSFRKYITTNRLISLIFAVTFLVYGNVLLNGFVMDDQGLILSNKNVHSITNLFNFFRGSIFDFGGNLGGVYYRPMMSTTFSLLYTFFGPNAFFFHLLQVILHGCNAMFVFLILRKFTRQYVAYGVALLFLVHPLNSETVSYIAALQDVLFFLFGIWAFFLLLRQEYEISKKTAWPYILLLLSLLSKETGIVFVFITFLYCFIFRKKYLSKHFIFTCATVAGYLFLRFIIAGIYIHKTEEFVMMRLPLSERLIQIPSIILYYLKTFFVPIKITSVQSWVAQLNSAEFYVPLIIVVAFLLVLSTTSFLVVKNRTEKKYLLFFSGWFGFGMLLHLQLIPLDLTVADRWFYFPMVGLMGIVAIMLEGSGVLKKIRSNTFYVGFILFGIVVLSLFAARTVLRNSQWKNTEILAESDLRIDTRNYQLLSALGGVYLEKKDYKQAIYYLDKSVEIYPHWGTSQYNLGVAYHMDKQVAEAKKYYTMAIDDAPNYINAYENLAILLLYNNELQAARDYSSQSLKKIPTSQKLWHVLALSEYKMGHYKESTEAAQMYYSLTKQ